MLDDDEDVGPDLSAARDALLAEFLRVFPTRRPEPFPPLVDNLHSSDAVQAAAAFAEARDWTSLDGEWLHAVPNTDNGLTTARCFLSNAALRFYLPAYLTASLKLQLDPMHTVTLGFDVRTRDALIDEARPERGSWGAYARTRWADLTPGQVRAVARFMEWHVALDERCIEVTRGLSRHRDTAEALAYYWAPRAAGF